MLEAVNLSKKYEGQNNGTLALNKLNLKVEPGEIYCLLGANGAGKTTTINLFLNFISPSSGQAFINGIDVTQNPVKTKQFLAYIPENLMLYPSLSGVENLEYFARLSGKNYPVQELESLLTEAGLQEDAHKRRISTYSKGMRQKVGIAIALAKEAQVLLLDEPTSGLDPKSSKEFAELLVRLSERGVATLMATHDLFRAKETGTHIGIMREGQLLESMSSDQLSHSDLENLYLERMQPA